MLEKSIAFLKQLRTNNNREWFHSNKKLHEEAKKEFNDFIAILIEGIASFDPALQLTTPKNSIFRINRDVRFSSDKSPYKINFGSYMAEGGKKSWNPCYYFHLEPGNNSFLAGGLYMPPADQLSMVRQEIDYNQEEFEELLSAPLFVRYFKELTGEKLKRPPKGYTKDNPVIELLKFKSFLAEQKLQDKEIEQLKNPKQLVERYMALKPLNDFLRKATASE